MPWTRCSARPRATGVDAFRLVLLRWAVMPMLPRPPANLRYGTLPRRLAPPRSRTSVAARGTRTRTSGASPPGRRNEAPACRALGGEGIRARGGRESVPDPARAVGRRKGAACAGQVGGEDGAPETATRGGPHAVEGRCSALAESNSRAGAGDVKERGTLGRLVARLTGRWHLERLAAIEEKVGAFGRGQREALEVQRRQLDELSRALPTRAMRGCARSPAPAGASAPVARAQDRTYRGLERAGVLDEQGAGDRRFTRRIERCCDKLPIIVGPWTERWDSS